MEIFRAVTGKKWSDRREEEEGREMERGNNRHGELKRMSTGIGQNDAVLTCIARRQ